MTRFALFTVRNDVPSFWEFERNGTEIIFDKTQTVEHKCKCALTEKGVVIKARLNKIVAPKQFQNFLICLYCVHYLGMFQVS